MKEIKKGIFKKLNKNYYLQDTCGKKCCLLFLSIFVSIGCFELQKKEYISNVNEISLKKEET